MKELDGVQAKRGARVIFGPGTNFDGVLHFSETLCIQGKFRGTIEAAGSLIVDQDAVVEADRIAVNSLTVFGTVSGHIHAEDSIDMMSGAKVQGDVRALRLRIADGVLFEGRCAMILADADIDLFSRPGAEIKAALQTPAGTALADPAQTPPEPFTPAGAAPAPLFRADPPGQNADGGPDTPDAESPPSPAAGMPPDA